MLLLLRPLTQSLETSAFLSQHGLGTCICPLEQTIYNIVSTNASLSVDAYIITSLNALFALKKFPPKPVYVVGMKTRALIPDTYPVMGIAPTIEALIPIISQGKAQRLLYLCGEVIKELPVIIGKTIQPLTVYRRIPDPVGLAVLPYLLAHYPLRGVLHFSAETSKIFLKYGAEKDLLSYIKDLTHICFSDHIGQVLQEQHIPNVHVTKTPDMLGMIDCLQALRNTL
jgi:uroporphyrinogen-III synthase